MPKEAVEDEENDEGTDVYSIPSLDKIEYDIDFSHTNQNSVTLGEINQLNQGKKKSSKKKVSQPPRKVGPEKSREQVFKEFQQEAGNSNKPISID